MYPLPYWDLHRCYSKIMRLAYNVICELQISGRLSRIGILTKIVKGLWAIRKSPRMAIMHTRFCHYFICSGWEVQGNSDMTIVISNCSICETISGTYGFGSSWLQANVASLRRSSGKNRYYPTTYSESICWCIVKQICPTVQALILACRRLGRRVFRVWCYCIQFCIRAYSAVHFPHTLRVCSILFCLHVIILNKIKGLAFAVDKCVGDWTFCNTTLYLCELSDLKDWNMWSELVTFWGYVQRIGRSLFVLSNDAFIISRCIASNGSVTGEW